MRPTPHPQCQAEPDRRRVDPTANRDIGCACEKQTGIIKQVTRTSHAFFWPNCGFVELHLNASVQMKNLGGDEDDFAPAAQWKRHIPAPRNR